MAAGGNGHRKDAKSIPPSSDNADLGLIDNNFLKEIYTTVLNHDATNPFNNCTCLFCTIEGDANLIMFRNTAIASNTVSEHTEKKLITNLTTNTEVTKSKQRSDSDPDLNITVYINNSPCSDVHHNCKKELKMFLKEHKKVRMFIYITSIYKVHRKSCQTHRHSPISDETHYEASAELWNLMQHDRCRISAYSEKVWEKLFDLAKESKETLRGYDKIVFKDQDVSRKEEDNRIKEDLVYIGVEILKKLYEMYPDTSHSGDAKITCLVCNIDAGETTSVKLAKYDKGGEHAVELLLKELGELDFGGEKLTITLFMNGIPCSLPVHKCANGLIEYLEKKNVDLTLYVTRLNELAQEYCTNYIHPRMCKVVQNDHSCVLKSLKKGRCTIKAPSEEAWRELFTIMNMREEDEIIQDFWKKYSIQNQSDDRSRKEEDERIGSYLDTIFKK